MQVAGYFQGVMGTGEHGRQLVKALRTQGARISLVTLHPEGSPEDEELSGASDEDAGDDHWAAFNLLCVNADMVPQTSAQLGRKFFTGRYTIGFWAWEVSAFPDRFASAFPHVDEIWVGSRHVRDAVSPAARCPVHVIPQPVSLEPLGANAAPPRGLPNGFRFLFAFDYLSVFERKNPLATIQAFATAFPAGAGASLIVKSLNPQHDPAAHKKLCAAVASHPDVHLIERRLPRVERDVLMREIDCYVSLHRAEGFGYTLAEAMWLGKPVVATNYSGNVDFMTPDNSYLVDHRLVPIGPGIDPYPTAAVWAEPDVTRAAALLRHVFEHPEEAHNRGSRAAADIRRTHGPEAAGRVMSARLNALIAAGLPRRSRFATTRLHRPGGLARVRARLPWPRA